VQIFRPVITQSKFGSGIEKRATFRIRQMKDKSP